MPSGSIRILAFAYDNRGYAYDAKGDHGQAIKDYDKSLALDPNYSAAYNDRGVAYDATGDHDHAIADETEAIRLKPDDGYAYFERAGAYAAKDDSVHALIDYRARRSGFGQAGPCGWQFEWPLLAVCDMARGTDEGHFAAEA